MTAHKHAQGNALKLIDDSRNWGDAIAKYLFYRLTGRKPTIIRMDRCSSQPHFLTVGSVLRMADSNSIVWGAGFLTPDDDIGGLNWRRQESRVLQRPLRICAVRGPLSRNKLERMGIDCPKVFGDPARLLATIHRSEAKSQFKLGIIPHFKDRRSEFIRRLQRYDDVVVIDPVCPRLSITNQSKYLRFLDQIQSCKYIASSSLHGFIMADAYGIPARWCSTSSVEWESEFKFFDYFASVGRPDSPPFRIAADTTLNDIISSFQPYKVHDYSDSLCAACPFIH